MLTRFITISAILVQLSGCIATPRIELAEHFDFDNVQTMPKPMSYSDLLCCYDCTA